MKTRFRDREEAGELLAERLNHYVDRPNVIVLALPRGGVPVAAVVAQSLHAPLDLLVVRKLGVPGYEELALGAIASGGVRILNAQVVESLRISDDIIDAVTRRESRELERREREYRGHRPVPEVKGRTVILVDDGVATGSTMFAAIAALHKRGAARIVVAVPAIAHSTCREMRRQCAELVTVIEPDEFQSVGQWYEDFSQTTDQEVRDLLASTGDLAPVR
jgi:predicted phosphoribosyltransferase